MTTNDDELAAGMISAEHAAAHHIYNQTYMRNVLGWPGIIAGLRKGQADDLADLLRVADDNEDFPLRPLLARAWAAGWVAGWDDKQPGNPLTHNPFDT